MFPPLLILDLGAEILCHIFFALKTEILEKSNERKMEWEPCELSC